MPEEPRVTAPDEPRVRVHRGDGGVVRVVLDRPAARNALDLPMCHQLRDAFEELDADPEVRVVLLAASGPAFCAGADLKERTGRDESWVRRRRLAAYAAYEAVERCAKPVVACVHGPVVGSGGEIAMACDFVLAADTTTFRFPEPRWGTVGATQRLQRVAGKRRAKELLFTGRELGVAEAREIGLVARVVPADELETAAAGLAEHVAQAPPLALALTKQAIDLGEEVDLDRGVRIEAAAVERLLADGGWRRGVAAFTSGRTDHRDGTGDAGKAGDTGGTGGAGGPNGTEQ